MIINGSGCIFVLGYFDVSIRDKKANGLNIFEMIFLVPVFHSLIKHFGIFSWYFDNACGFNYPRSITGKIYRFMLKKFNVKEDRISLDYAPLFAAPSKICPQNEGAVNVKQLAAKFSKTNQISGFNCKFDLPHTQ